jgi:hypothetical protein
MVKNKYNGRSFDNEKNGFHRMVVVIIALLIVILSSCRKDNQLGTIEGVLVFISNTETINVTIYRPEYTPYEVRVSKELLFILQTDKWERITGRWSIDAVVWDEVIVINYLDGGRAYIEKGTAVTYWEYAIPVIERRHTLYSIPMEVAEKLLAYVLENHSLHD